MATTVHLRVVTNAQIHWVGTRKGWQVEAEQKKYMLWSCVEVMHGLQGGNVSPILADRITQSMGERKETQTITKHKNKHIKTEHVDGFIKLTAKGQVSNMKVPDLRKTHIICNFLGSKNSKKEENRLANKENK